MIIGILNLELDIPHAMSLKDKRAVVQRIRDRSRRKFNIAVAEVENNNLWNRAVLAIVTVANEQTHANQVLSKVLELIESMPDSRIDDVTMEFL